MPTWTFIKRGGAPSGAINIDVADGTFVIDDASNTTIATTNPQIAGELYTSPYLQLQGGSPTGAPAPQQIRGVQLVDGVLSKPAPGGGYTAFDGSELPALTGAALGVANVFTAPQTFKTSGSPLTLQDGSAGGLVTFLNTGAAGGGRAVQMNLYGSNAPGPGGAAWYVALDVSAPTPYRDFVIGKFAASGSALDSNGFYISNAGEGNPSSIGCGFTRPIETGDPYRMKIAAPGTTTSTPQATMGGLQIAWNSGQTGDMFNVGTSGGSDAFRVTVDGQVHARGSSSADITVSDAVTNGTATVTSATANFSALHVGRYLTGTNIASGSYILSVTNSTTIVMDRVATGSGSGGTLTLAGRAHQFRSGGNLPMFTIGTNGAGGTSLVSGLALVGIGEAVGPAPGSTLDIARPSGSAASLSVRQASGGNFKITTSTTDVQLATQNATALRLGSNAGVIALSLDTSSNVLVGPGAKATPAELATSATSGFFGIPTFNGAPSGTPASNPTGIAWLGYDRVNKKLMVYDAGTTSWKGVTVA